MIRVQGNTVLWCLADILLLGLCNGLSDQLPLSYKQPRGVVWQHATHQGRRAAAAAVLQGTVQASVSSSSSSSRLPVSRLAAPSLIPQGNHTAVQLSVHGYRSLSRRLRRQRRYLASSQAALAKARAQPVLPYPKDPAGVQRYLRDAENSAAAPYVIPVWFVVVVDPVNSQATNISSQQVAAQLDLLNSAYATGLASSSSSVITESGSGSNLRLGNAAAMVAAARGHAKMRTRRRPLSSSSSSSGQLWQFQLMGIRYTISSSPMCIGSSTEQHIKQAWRQQLIKEGGTVDDRTLVVYVSDITASSCKGKVAGYSVVFGYGSTPYDLVFWKQHSMQHRDGVVIDARYLLHPGMQQAGAGMLHGAASGAQLVHEIGHWMGLVHTWDGGCQPTEAETDQVDDTPAEAHPTEWGVDMKDASSGCKLRDSCGTLPGQDIYENYMTYNNLACARSFTAGQQARMLYLFRAVRKDRR